MQGFFHLEHSYKVEAIYNGVGRAFNTASSGQAYRYEYYLKDHLGNIRLSFTDKNNDGRINNQGEILQENQYYPFGMMQHGSWYDDATVANYPYLYNDKELTTDFGLNLSDYGARGYDAAIGRWWQVDPLAEQYYPLTPYAYVANNPLKFIDPDGREIWISYGDNQRVRYEGGGLYNQDGSRYKGNDKFVRSTSRLLGMMGKTKIGEAVLGELSSSTNSFTFINETPASGATAANINNSNTEAKGSKIRAGGILSGKSDDMAKLSEVAHELFHAYQHEFNPEERGGPSVNKEVGAYLFGSAVQLGYSDGAGALDFGNASQNGKVYHNMMQNMLLIESSFNPQTYSKAVQYFKSGAAANNPNTKHPKGPYTDFPVRSVGNPSIKKFFPLLR